MAIDFARAKELFALVAAAMAMPDFTQQRTALAAIPEYRSNGKNKTRWHHAGGHLAQRRAAAKRRNVIRNRRAHRG